MRVFYKQFELRATAIAALKATATEMQDTYMRSIQPLTNNDLNQNEKKYPAEARRCFVKDFNIYKLNDGGICLDVPERVFFRAYITKQNHQQYWHGIRDRASVRASIPGHEFQLYYMQQLQRVWTTSHCLSNLRTKSSPSSKSCDCV